MPRHTTDETEWDDDPNWDADGISDDFGDDSEPAIPCPHCGEDVYEDAERCPHCEHYLSEEDPPPAPKSWLILIGTAVCLYIVYHWLVG
jgi:hypothetical protein